LALPTLQSLITEVRARRSEPNVNGRWTNALLTGVINRAQQQVMLDVQWPEATGYTPTVAGQQEYTLPELISILRVYMIFLPGSPGQPMVPTSINRLEGDTLGYFDQSTTQYQTQWQTQNSSAYPVSSGNGYPQIASILPPAYGGYSGQRPQYYLRGGNLGCVPIPAVSTYSIQLDYIPIPPTLVNLGDQSILPDAFVDAIVYKTMYYMASAESNPVKMADADKMYGGLPQERGTGGAIGKLLSWKGNLLTHEPRAVIFTTARTRFNGPPRVGSGQGRHGR
jgi:hypothetical protein